MWARKLRSCGLKPLTGGETPFSENDLQGKVTLINFWGPWCQPCRIEFPHLLEIEQHFRKSDRFQFLSISYSGKSGSDEEMGPSTAEFLEEFGAEFPTFRDPNQQFLRHMVEIAKLDSFNFPTSVVVDEHGVILGLWSGYAPGDEAPFTGSSKRPSCPPNKGGSAAILQASLGLPAQEFGPKCGAGLEPRPCVTACLQMTCSGCVRYCTPAYTTITSPAHAQNPWRADAP